MATCRAAPPPRRRLLPPPPEPTTTRRVRRFQRTTWVVQPGRERTPLPVDLGLRHKATRSPRRPRTATMAAEPPSGRGAPPDRSPEPGRPRTKARRGGDNEPPVRTATAALPDKAQAPPPVRAPPPAANLSPSCGESLGTRHCRGTAPVVGQTPPPAQPLQAELSRQGTLTAIAATGHEPMAAAAADGTPSTGEGGGGSECAWQRGQPGHRQSK